MTCQHDQRYPTDTTCEIRYLENSQLRGGEAKITDLSIHGVRLEFALPIPNGTPVLVQIADHEPIYVQILRVAAGEGERRIYGGKYIEGSISYSLFTELAFPKSEVSMQTVGLDFVCSRR
ncbi:MAG: hypothetical protein U1D30_12650 [Planctomycetota bacterium]